METWQRYTRAAMVLCLVLLACAAICAAADSGAMTSAPRDKNRQRTGMSGKGVWFSVISFMTSIGWIMTSERETVRSSGLWVQAGRRAKTAKSPKEADKGAVVSNATTVRAGWCTRVGQGFTTCARFLLCAGRFTLLATHPARRSSATRCLASKRRPRHLCSGAPLCAEPALFRQRHACRHERPRGVWAASTLSLCRCTFRRVVEQYLWHEKTKGRKHKMQIHTYHKVSVTACCLLLRHASLVLLRPVDRRGRGGSSTQANSWTTDRTETRRSNPTRCGTPRLRQRKALSAISSCPLTCSDS